jgi:type IV pilus assembly protein PilV
MRINPSTGRSIGMAPNSQRGVTLVEAMIAMLLVSLAILGVIALYGSAVVASNDAQLRAEAQHYAQQLLTQIRTNTPRTTAGEIDGAALAVFDHWNGGPDRCPFAGAASGSPIVAQWVNRLQDAKGLPGAAGPGYQRVAVDAANANEVRVTICWRGPQDAAPRNHDTVAYIN